MPLKTNRLLVLGGTYTLIQAQIQLMVSLTAIAQYFCIIDFMRTYPILIFIRILYFNNASSCGGDINIGEAIDGMANQAYVYLSSTPHTALRTLIFSSISLGLSVLWLLASIILIKGGFRQPHSNHTHWPWLSVTFLVSFMDMIGAVVYFNDLFHTRTLSDIVQYINASASGLGNSNPNTQLASWILVAFSGRFGIFLVINVALIVSAIWDCTRIQTSDTTSELEQNVVNHDLSPNKAESAKGSDESSPRTPSETLPKIPRPGLTQSFRSMKDLLFRRANSTESLNGGRNRNRVNFVAEEIQSDPIQIPVSFENLIAEQQRRLNGAAVDTSGRHRAPQAAGSLPQLNTNAPETSRSPAGRLAGQMPWAYIAGAPTNRMRDQLPPDEDLPPVPLPDYTAFQSARKASVHRAASSLSSLTQKKEYVNSKSSHRVNASRRPVLTTEQPSAKPIKPNVSRDAPPNNPSGSNTVTSTRVCANDPENSEDSSSLSFSPPLPPRGVPPLPEDLHEEIAPSSRMKFTSFEVPCSLDVKVLRRKTVNIMFPRPVHLGMMVCDESGIPRMSVSRFMSQAQTSCVTKPNIASRSSRLTPNKVSANVPMSNVRSPNLVPSIQTLPFQRTVGQESDLTFLDVIMSNIKTIMLLIVILMFILVLLLLLTDVLGFAQ